jgi:hypothetical protein
MSIDIITNTALRGASRTGVFSRSKLKKRRDTEQSRNPPVKDYSEKGPKWALTFLEIDGILTVLTKLVQLLPAG